MSRSPFVRRVRLANYKSIAKCDVELRSLTFLVGRNGSGKSNFLDALRFVRDALRVSLDHAVRDRGGINEVRRRSGGHPNHFGIRLDFTLPNGATGHYSFRIGARPQGTYEVQTEQCTIRDPNLLAPVHSFIVQQGKAHIRNGNTQSAHQPLPLADTDRLYLVRAAGVPAFRPVYDSLSRMGFYNLNPDRIRDLQPPDRGEVLARDGSNIASVLARIQKQEPSAKERIEQYLGAVVPGVRAVATKVIGPKETLEFRQQVAGSSEPWRFLAANMSDGTLRALAILVALFQSVNGRQDRVPLVGIEEPEVALHPAAVGVLLDALREASRDTQIIVTSHSPDLLEDKEIDPDEILSVTAADGTTKIGPIDPAGKSALRDHLYTAGELLRLDHVSPDPEAIRKQEARQLRLFDEVCD